MLGVSLSFNVVSMKKFQMSFEQKNKIIHGLDLKQLGRRRGGGAGNGNGSKNKSTMISSSVQANKLNGEWESHHDFMCSTCAIGK